MSSHSSPSKTACPRYDDDEDEELLRLLPFLESVAHVDDVRPAIQSRFRLREVVEAVQDPCGDWCA